MMENVPQSPSQVCNTHVDDRNCGLVTGKSPIPISTITHGLSEGDLLHLIEITKERSGMADQSPVSISALTSRLQALKDTIESGNPLVPNSGAEGPSGGDEISSPIVRSLELGLDVVALAEPRFAKDAALKWSDRVESDELRFEHVQDSLVRTRAKGLTTASEVGYVPVGDIMETSLQGMNLSSLAVQSSLSGENDIQVRRLNDMGHHPQQTQGGRGRGRGRGSYRGGRGRGGRGNPNRVVDHSAGISTTKSWAEVANTPSRSSIKLRYIPPKSSDPIVVELPVRQVGLEKWEACLVGYFLDKKLPFNYIRNGASNLWKNMGLKEVLANGEGFMFFIFDNTDSCNKVFEGGPWYMGNQLLILKKWKKMMRLTKEHVSQIPVWVKFFNIPMEYWDHEGLSRIARKIGVPLFMDHLTSTGTRVSFAGVCVEVDVTSELPHQFFVRCEDEVVEIKVEYQGLPAKCEHCRVFGHDAKKCVTAQVEKLTQMQKVTEVATEDEWQHVKDKGKKKVGVPEGDVQTVEHTHPPPVETAAKVVLEEGLNHVDDPLQLLHKEIQGLASALDTVAEAPSGLEEPVDEVDTEEEMLAAMVDKLSTPRKKARQQGELTSRQNSSGKSGSQWKKKKFNSVYLINFSCYLPPNHLQTTNARLLEHDKSWKTSNNRPEISYEK